MLLILSTPAIASTACDAEKVDALVGSLASVSEEERLARAIAGVGAACGSLAAAASALAAPADRDASDKKLAAPGSLWQSACPKGLAAAAMASGMDHANARAFLFDQCGLAKHDLDRALYVGGDGPTVFTILAAQALTGLPDASRRPVLDALIGQPTGAPPPAPAPAGGVGGLAAPPG